MLRIANYFASHSAQFPWYTKLLKNEEAFNSYHKESVSVVGIFFFQKLSI